MTAAAEEGKTYTTKESWHTADDGVKFYAKTWTPSGPIKARVVFMHGFSDYCNNTGILFPEFATSGIEVCSWDQRGWGNSVLTPSQKGLTGPTSRMVDDVTSFIEPYLATSEPLFLMGHSMGGGQCLAYAVLGPASVRQRLRGFISVSPLIKLDPKTQPWRITEMVARQLVKVVPRHTMVQKLDERLLTRDAELNKKYRTDKLVHNTGTLEGLGAMLDRGNQLADKTLVPKEDCRPVGDTGLLLLHGTKDGITSCEASEAWFGSCEFKDKEFKKYDGWYHVLHREPNGDDLKFAEDVKKWILARS